MSLIEKLIFVLKANNKDNIVDFVLFIIREFESYFQYRYLIIKISNEYIKYIDQL